MIANEDFSDNPMYPFSVTEPTDLCVSLFQADRRWSVSRLGESLRDLKCSEFLRRADRLAACMKYRVGIGFVILKLNGLF